MKKLHPFVTVLVLNFNGQFLKRCLDSLLMTDYPNFEVVVIDNGSLDDSVKFIKSNYPQVKIIEHNRNYGFALGYNLVIDSIKSEFIVLLNNDVFTTHDWLKKLVIYAENDGVAAVTPKMLFFQNKKRINAAGGKCDIYGVGWNRGNGEIDQGQYDKVEEVFYGNGGALLVKKRVWHKVGPFDERYFIYGEDLDWCWRAKLQGYKILYVPDARVYHFWRGSGAPMINFLEKHWLATLLKNYSLKTLIQLLPKYLALKVLKAMWLIKNGRRNEKAAVFKSVLWNIVNLKGTWEKRVQIQASRKVSDKEIQKGLYEGSFELSLYFGKMKHPIMQLPDR